MGGLPVDWQEVRKEIIVNLRGNANKAADRTPRPGPMWTSAAHRIFVNYIAAGLPLLKGFSLKRNNGMGYVGPGGVVCPKCVFSVF